MCGGGELRAGPKASGLQALQVSRPWRPFSGATLLSCSVPLLPLYTQSTAFTPLNCTPHTLFTPLDSDHRLKPSVLLFFASGLFLQPYVLFYVNYPCRHISSVRHSQENVEELGSLLRGHWAALFSIVVNIETCLRTPPPFFMNEGQ